MITSIPEKDAFPTQFNHTASVSTDSKPYLVITAGLDGIRNSRIVAYESSQEESLRYALKAVEPLLRLLHEALRSLRMDHSEGSEN